MVALFIILAGILILIICKISSYIFSKFSEIDDACFYFYKYRPLSKGSIFIFFILLLFAAVATRFLCENFFSSGYLRHHYYIHYLDDLHFFALKQALFANLVILACMPFVLFCTRVAKKTNLQMLVLLGWAFLLALINIISIIGIIVMTIAAIYCHQEDQDRKRTVVYLDD